MECIRSDIKLTFFVPFALAAGFAAAFLISFFALVTFPATVFLMVGFLAAGAFLGLATAGFLTVFLVGAGAGAALSNTRGFELPVLLRVCEANKSV